MELQRYRLKSGLTVKELMGRQMHKSLYSHIEHGTVLPNVETMRYLCLKLGAKPLDLYEREEIDLIGCMDSPSKFASETKRKDYHKVRGKMTFRVPEGVKTAFTSEKLAYCGYSSYQSWFDACVKRFFGEYAAKRKSERRKGHE